MKEKTPYPCYNDIMQPHYGTYSGLEHEEPSRTTNEQDYHTGVIGNDVFL